MSEESVRAGGCAKRSRDRARPSQRRNFDAQIDPHGTARVARRDSTGRGRRPGRARRPTGASRSLHAGCVHRAQKHSTRSRPAPSSGRAHRELAPSGGPPSAAIVAAISRAAAVSQAITARSESGVPQPARSPARLGDRDRKKRRPETTTASDDGSALATSDQPAGEGGRANAAYRQGLLQGSARRSARRPYAARTHRR